MISPAPSNVKLCLKTALLHMQVDFTWCYTVDQLPRRSIFSSNSFPSDHVGFGPDRQTTAAVGILKCVRCEESHEYNRISKVNFM